MRNMKFVGKMGVMSAALCAAVGLAGHVSAVTLTASTLNDTLTNVNTITFTTTPVFTAPDDVDSLFYLPNGSIVYDLETEQQVRLYNPTTHTDSLIASHAGWSNQLLDMALEPGQTSFLLSDHQAGTDGGGVYRVTLGGTVTHLVNGTGYQGVAFNPANAGAFYVANDGNGSFYYLDEYNSTGTTLLSQLAIPKANGGQEIDGLTWDPYTGELWGAIKYGGIGEFKIDPITGLLTGYTIFQSSVFNDVDGITTDGAGNLYLVVRSQTNSYDGGGDVLYANTIGIYNIAGNSLSPGSNNIPGLDDLAPAAGLGSNTPNSPVPLPASVWTGLALLGGMGIVAGVRRRKLALARVN